MSTPVETIAEALIAFILSLLRDPEKVEEFNAAPQALLAQEGLEDACAADVKAVAPVVIDNPVVVPRPVPVTPPEPADEVVNEITRIVNRFMIDNRSTIVDQSTNQNIWADGDVTQHFDQDAIVSSGDDAIAAGDDVGIDDSETTVTVGDVAIGNTDGSHNTTTTGDGAADDTADTEEQAQADGTQEETADDTASAISTAVDASVAAAETPEAAVAPASEPAPEPLTTDLTAAETYDADEPLTPPEPEPYPVEPAEEQ